MFPVSGDVSSSVCQAPHAPGSGAGGCDGPQQQRDRLQVLPQDRAEDSLRLCHPLRGLQWRISALEHKISSCKSVTEMRLSMGDYWRVKEQAGSVCGPCPTRESFASSEIKLERSVSEIHFFPFLAPAFQYSGREALSHLKCVLSSVDPGWALGRVCHVEPSKPPLTWTLLGLLPPSGTKV